MAMHEKVELQYDGQTYIVESDRVMGLVESVESVVTIDELVNTKKLQPAKLSRAYTAALNYAGCEVSQSSVYAAMFSATHSTSVVDTIQALLMMMVPPDFITEDEPAPAKKKPVRKKKKAKSS